MKRNNKFFSMLYVVLCLAFFYLPILVTMIFSNIIIRIGQRHPHITICIKSFLIPGKIPCPDFLFVGRIFLYGSRRGIRKILINFRSHRAYCCYIYFFGKIRKICSCSQSAENPCAKEQNCSCFQQFFFHLHSPLPESLKCHHFVTPPDSPLF